MAETKTEVKPVGGCCKQHFPDDLPPMLVGIMSAEAYARVMADVTKGHRSYWTPDTVILMLLTAGLYLACKNCVHCKKMNKMLEQHQDIPHDRVKMEYKQVGSGESGAEEVLYITLLPVGQALGQVS
mmetsp:Transcript_16785/g.39495  ORF Transcript_16785/g.39495 Transcript_16785/m.39495 type:complete len:127 (+) Transcript_16785:58-438(+)